MSKSNKGAQFERFISKDLSLWWTNGERDDLFWRTAGSGAMAKTRAKCGKDTFGQCGDIQATDPLAQPFLNLMSIEAKRGYTKTNLFDLLDNPRTSAVHQLEKFIYQAIIDHRNSGSKYWCLIYKRDRTEILMFIPKKLYVHFNCIGLKPRKRIFLNFPLRILKKKKAVMRIDAVIFPYSDFKDQLTSDNIIKILNSI